MARLYVIFIHCYKYHGQMDTAKYAVDEETREKGRAQEIQNL